jgi:tRNA 2-selenouridine synthase
VRTFKLTVDFKVKEPLELSPFLLQASSNILLDVRSPVEFERGHIPGAQSFPLFDDSERAIVGTSYKQQGRQMAIVDGLGLIGPKLENMAKMLLSIAEQNAIYLYCARGGMRSGSVCWLAELLQVEVYWLEGGYRRYRQWVSDLWEKNWKLRVLGGLTGVGKTQLLYSLKEAGAQIIDLEGVANHKGSAFGGVLEEPQPTQSQFENDLAEYLNGLDDSRPIWIEDESRLVGHRAVPSPLWKQMREQPVLYVARPMSFRLNLLAELYGEADPNILIVCTEKIQRRLGPQRTEQARNAILQGDLQTAVALVLEYYDQTYKHGLSKRQKVVHIDLGLDEGIIAAQRLDQAWSESWNESIELS